MLIAALVTAIVATLVTTSHSRVVSQADDWPMFRGNPQSTGVAAAELPESLEELWRFQVPLGSFESTPAIVDGVVYLTDFDGTLIALDLASGQKKWEVETGLGFSGSPSVFDGRIYVGDLAGEFYCFDSSGKKIWQFSASAEINSSANFFQDKVLIGSQDAMLYCLNAKTGEQVWQFNANDQIQCSPTVVGDRCFLAGCDAKMHVIDLNQGTEVGSVEMSRRWPHRSSRGTGCSAAPSKQVFLRSTGGS